MCSPALAFAALGAGQAVLGHSAAVSAADASNRNKLRMFNARRGRVYGEHFSNLTTYYSKGVDAEIAWAENALAANRGVQSKIQEIKQRTNEALRQNTESYVEMISDARLGKASEIAGKSARRVQKSLSAKYGRIKATRKSQIDDQADAADMIIRQILERQRIADINAQRRIGNAPRRGAMPNEPVWDKGPGMLSLIVNTAIGAASGYQAGGGKLGDLFKSTKTGGFDSSALWSSAKADLPWISAPTDFTSFSTTPLQSVNYTGGRMFDLTNSLQNTFGNKLNTFNLPWTSTPYAP